MSEELRYFRALDPDMKFVGMVAGKTAFEALMRLPPGHGFEHDPEMVEQDMEEIVAGLQWLKEIEDNGGNSNG